MREGARAKIIIRRPYCAYMCVRFQTRKRLYVARL